MPVSAVFMNALLEYGVGERFLQISVQCLIGYIPGRVSNGSENFGLVYLHDCSIRFAGAAPQHNAIGLYGLQNRFIYEYFVL
jgi:hypothetical protein